MTTSAVTPDATSVLGGDDSARDFDTGAQSATPQAQTSASQAAPASPQAQTPQPQSPGQITPQQPQGQGQATPPHHGLLSDIVKAVGSILGGPTDVSTIDPHTGDIVRVPLSRSARIANTAGILLRGAAAGAAQHGPGSVGKAALAGVQEQQGAQEQQQQQLQEQARTTQGALAQQASHALQQQQMAESAWRMQREKTEVDEASADKLNSYRQLVASDPANKDWGHYESFADFADQHQDLQKQGVNLAQLQAQGKLIAVPTTEGGKITGVNVFQVGPDWAKQKNAEPITIKRPSGVDEKGAVQYDSVTIPAGAVDNGTMMSYWASGAKDGMDAAETQARIAGQQQATEASKEKLPGELQQQEATLARTQAETEAAKAGGPADPNLVAAIRQGKIAPERLGYLLGRKEGQALLAAVAADGVTDTSKLEAYPKVYQEFTSTKPNTAGAQINSGATVLEHLDKLKALNTVESHIPHTPDYTAYKNQVDTLAPELAKFYGHSTDADIKSYKDTLMSTLPGNRLSAIETQAKSMGKKLDNFRQQWDNAAPSASYEAPMPGMSDQAKLARGRLDSDYGAKIFSLSKWQQANPQGDPKAASATAKQQGLEVIQ